MASDKYPFTADTVFSSARRLVAITAADTDLTEIPKAIFAGGEGTLVITAADDSVAVTLTVPAGTLLPIRAKRIGASSTATGIVGLY